MLLHNLAYKIDHTCCHEIKLKLRGLEFVKTLENLSKGGLTVPYVLAFSAFFLSQTVHGDKRDNTWDKKSKILGKLGDK
jgi:hypothetical protein